MAPPKGSRNNPSGRRPLAEGKRRVPFRVRLSPESGAWVKRSAQKLGCTETDVIDAVVRFAMEQELKGR